jgi:hypothetical protein
MPEFRLKLFRRFEGYEVVRSETVPKAILWPIGEGGGLSCFLELGPVPERADKTFALVRWDKFQPGPEIRPNSYRPPLFGFGNLSRNYQTACVEPNFLPRELLYFFAANSREPLEGKHRLHPVAGRVQQPLHFVWLQNLNFSIAFR